MTSQPPSNAPLRLLRAGIDSGPEPVLYLPRHSPVLADKGFHAGQRVEVAANGRSVLATLSIVEAGVSPGPAPALSEAAWFALTAMAPSSVAPAPAPAGAGSRTAENCAENSAQDRADAAIEATLHHPAPVVSTAHTRAKLHGQRYAAAALQAIVADVAAGRYSPLELASFVTACAGNHLDTAETVGLARAMANVGDRLDWGGGLVMDKHCVGGLPGNRTTLIVVPIIAACGLRIPKTSSRAITSPAGTADAMETLAPVDLSLPALRRAVERTGACIAWGGAVRLSPADDILIRVARPLALDSRGQMVASILSKKAAAGATHVLVDMPLGPTAKVRDALAADTLQGLLEAAATALGLVLRVVRSNGLAPVGRGIGPALEARDVLAVLRCDPQAPADLRARSLHLAGELLELAGAAPRGTGRAMAETVLDDGRAWRKFQDICEAQGAPGGPREPPVARWQAPVTAPYAGQVTGFDNRAIARIARLAGAPLTPLAGLLLHVGAGDAVEAGQPLFTVHADSPGELASALDDADRQAPAVQIAREATPPTGRGMPPGAG